METEGFESLKISAFTEVLNKTKDSIEGLEKTLSLTGYLKKTKGPSKGWNKSKGLKKILSQPKA